MKFKEVAAELRNKPDFGEIQLATLYHGELERRAADRWRSGKIPLGGFCILLKEMNQWIVKVCLEAGLTEGRAKYLMRLFNEQAYAAAERAALLQRIDNP